MAKKKTLAPTPRIRAKTITAANLLRRIKKEVLAEPKRADLRMWITTLQGQDSGWKDALTPEPACGTVACLAGWGAVLMRPAKINAAFLNNTAASRMCCWLGTPEASATPGPGLFAAGPVLRFGETRDTFGEPGTEQHAQTIAKRIDTFLAQHPELETRVIDVEAERRNW